MCIGCRQNKQREKIGMSGTDFASNQDKVIGLLKSARTGDTRLKTGTVPGKPGCLVTLKVQRGSSSLPPLAVELLVQLSQLLQEARVWRDVPVGADGFDGLRQCHALVDHQVGQDQGG